MYPFNQIEEISRKNIAMFEQAVNMFSPFPHQRQDGEHPAGQNDKGGEAAAPHEAETSLDDLKARLEAMQRQLDELSRGKGE